MDTLPKTDTLPKIDTGWHEIAAIPGGGRTYATGFVLNGKGYVCGGVYKFAGDGIKGYDDMYMYDPAKNTWTLKTGLPDIGYYGTQGRMRPFSFVLNNIAYAGGGISVNGVGGGDVEQYDALVDKWTLKAKNYTFDFSAADTCDKKGYIYSYSSAASQTWAYDPTKSDPLSDVFDNGYLGANSGSPNTNNTWIVGGFGDLYIGAYGNYFEVRDLQTGVFSDSNTSLSNATYTQGGPVTTNAVIYKNCIYISMGEEGHLYRYNLKTNIWQMLTNRTLSITDGVASFLIGSRLYYVGGNNGLFTISTDKAWVIDLDLYPEN